MDVLCLVLIFVMQYLVAFLPWQPSLMGRESWLFTLNIFLVSCDSKCSVDLHHGAVGWSAMCHCGISWL